MFTVRYLSLDKEEYRPLAAGVAFGFTGQPVFFELNAKDAPGPLKISLTIEDDPKKDDLHFTIGDINDGVLPLTFANAAGSGISGLALPLSILVIQDELLALMFSVEFTGTGRKMFRLTYEFVHGRRPGPGSEDGS